MPDLRGSLQNITFGGGSRESLRVWGAKRSAPGVSLRSWQRRPSARPLLGSLQHNVPASERGFCFGEIKTDSPHQAAVGSRGRGAGVLRCRVGEPFPRSRVRVAGSRDTFPAAPAAPGHPPLCKAVLSRFRLAKPAEQRGRAAPCAGCVYLKYLILPNTPRLIWGL